MTDLWRPCIDSFCVRYVCLWLCPVCLNLVLPLQPQFPPFPTTTIGSFPQTPEVRRLRLQLKSGKISQEEYERQIDMHISFAIGVQESLELDVLVHGESERTDMVEYFGVSLDGLAFTLNGWVQSYGSRYVRPPLIVGDVQFQKPMTVREFQVRV